MTALILVAGIVVVSLLRDRIVSTQNWTVSVAGSAKFYAEPDTAKIVMGVQLDKAPTAQQALDQLNKKMNEVYNAVKAAGIPEEQIKTQNFSLFPQYDYVDGVSKVSGYNANQMLTVTVKDLSENQKMVSAVIEAASNAGVNQIQNVTFEVSDIETLKQEARVNAIADAKKNAKELAKSLDVDLEEIVGWWENSNYPMYNDMGMGGGAELAKGMFSGSPVVPSGQQEFRIDVTVNYLID